MCMQAFALQANGFDPAISPVSLCYIRSAAVGMLAHKFG